jgi:predicted small secreted protein
MKLVRIVSILLAALAVSLAGCQTDGGGGSSGSTTNSGSSGGY